MGTSLSTWVSLLKVLSGGHLSAGIMASKSASNFARNWEKINKELTCAMCKHLLDDPKILPCLHSFCTSCLKERSDKLVQCPSCKSEVLLSTRAIEELPSHFSAIRSVEIIRLLEQVNNKKGSTPICRNCNKGDMAVSVCYRCKKYLCKLCKDVHRIETSEHILYSLNVLSTTTDWIPWMLPSEKAVEMCPIHPTKTLEFYCKYEKVMICYNCTIERHKDHDYDVISDAKKILRETLPDIQQLVGEVENAIANVKGRRKMVSTRKEENLKKLDDTFRTLHAALDKRQKELKENITKTLQAKDKNLEVQEDELCFLSSQLKSCHSFIEDKVQRGVNQDVLAMNKAMLERRDKLKEIKNNTKLYPVEQYPLPIKLKDMDEVVNLISQLTE